MKLRVQIAILTLVALLFTSLNVSIYMLFTRRCVDDMSVEMRKNGIELSAYLPFTEGTLAVKVDSSLRLGEDLPVLDGAAALYPVFASVVNSVYPEGSAKFDGESFKSDSALQFSNTLRAYKAVCDGDADIVFCAAPSKEQMEYAKEVGAELTLVPVGYEAFVFIVNENNPVDDLSVEELRGIFSGKYTSWSELGGERRLIDPKTRLAGSGSQTVMENFMGDTEIKTNPFGFLGSSIGYSFRYYVESVPHSESVKMLSVNGVSPTTENIKNGSYPIVCSFYAVCRADNDNPNVKALIDWLLSEEGQRLIEEVGYVGI